MKALVYHGPGERAWEDSRPDHPGRKRRGGASRPLPVGGYDTALDVFGQPTDTGALKVLLTAPHD
jgi:hypothetical protein